MKKITLLLATIFSAAFANAQQIPNLTFGQAEFYPSGAVDGSAGSVFDPATMYSIGGNPYSQVDYIASIALQTPGDIVLTPGASALIEIYLPPFVRDYVISLDGPVLAAGNPSVRITNLGKSVVGSIAPQNYVAGTVSESNWGFIHSANRNFSTIREANYTTQSSIARVVLYNGLNFGYTSPLTNYSSSINIDQIRVHWYVAQEDSLDYVDWANGTVTGINDVNEEIVAVYPNPASNVLNINGYGKAMSQVRVFDMAGKTVLLRQNLNQNKIDVRSLIQGVYFVEIKSDYAVNVVKFIKE